ncbi:MAG: DMT family transporter [Pikeienuella sp.]
MIAALYRSPVLLLTFTAVMWSMNVIFGQWAVGEISPFAIVLLRWIFVSAMMWPLFGREVVAHWPALRPRIGFLALCAVTGFTGFNTLFYIASSHTSGINIGILQGAMPMMVLLGVFVAYGDRVRPRQMIGVAITLVGVILVAGGGDIDRLLGLSFNKGDLLMLAACAAYTFYAVALRNRPAVPGAALFTFFTVVSALCALPLALWEAAQPGYAWPSLTGVALALVVAVFPSCLAQLFFLRGVDLIGPGRAGVYINLVPIFAAILSILILGERLALYHAVALALVIGGIWMTQRAR